VSADGRLEPVSIIVPTFNEAGDIRRTLDALVAQTYPLKEIIVVDDSTDDTPHIVGEYADRGVRLLRPVRRRGRCEARNLGIREAQGSVIVILNADVFPAPDFLARVAAHYRLGADYVLVESRIANTTALIPRYLEAMHRCSYAGQDWIEWTEGFSCRRAAALDVGLFPETPLPLLAGEDGYFGIRLAQRYRKVIDRSIVVPHIAPESIREFWGQQTSRGRASGRYRFFLERKGLFALVLNAAAKTVRTAMTVGLFVPMLAICLRLRRHTPRGVRDVPGFCAVFALNEAAQIYGEWVGVRDIFRYRRRHPAASHLSVL
jgi:glycosyltransferase involved in cell wall biosynthesis